MISKEILDTFPYNHDCYECMKRKDSYVYFMSYGTRVCFVAHVSIYDWRVYVDSTKEKSHRDAVESVLSIGTKLKENHARALFPAIARWADKIGLDYA